MMDQYRLQIGKEYVVFHLPTLLSIEERMRQFQDRLLWTSSVQSSRTQPLTQALGSPLLQDVLKGLSKIPFEPSFNRLRPRVCNTSMVVKGVLTSYFKSEV